MRSWGAWFWDRLPLTSAGLLLLLSLPGAIWLLGVKSLDLVVLMAASAALAVLLLLVVQSVLCGLWLRWRGRRPAPAEPLALQAGSWYPSGFRRRLWRWLPLLTFGWRLDPGFEVEVRRRGGWLEEHVLPRRRGLWTSLTRRFEVSDSLGLSKLRWSQAAPGSVRVLPDPGKLAQLPLMVKLASGEDISDPRGDPSGDRVDMRQYTKGDSPRTILWKVYARTRRLMVRVPERALTARPRVCAYLVTSPADEPAAGLARVVLEKGLLGAGWRFGSDGVAGHDSTLEAALTRLARSGHEAGAPCALKPFLQQAAADGYSMCVLLLAPEGKPGLAEALASSPLPVSLYLAQDSLPARPHASRWRRWLVEGETAGEDGLLQAARTWARHPGEVLLVDRKAGAMVGDLRQYARRLSS